MQTYRGASVASEEETQTMAEWTLDRNFAKVLDYHSYGQQVLNGYR
jgi:zinc carboxypeptidase